METANVPSLLDKVEKVACHWMKKASPNPGDSISWKQLKLLSTIQDSSRRKTKLTSLLFARSKAFSLNIVPNPIPLYNIKHAPKTMV